MHTQLMRSARPRSQHQERVASVGSQYLVERHGSLAVRPAARKTLAISGVPPDFCIDSAGSLGRRAFDYGQIRLPDPAFPELQGQLLVGRGILGTDDHA